MSNLSRIVFVYIIFGLLSPPPTSLPSLGSLLFISASKIAQWTKSLTTLQGTLLVGNPKPMFFFILILKRSSTEEWKWQFQARVILHN